MDLAIRVNVRYAAPADSQIKDALRMFKSARWVQSIIRYIMPQLNSVSPAAVRVLEDLKRELRAAPAGASCVVCMDEFDAPCAQLPCGHQFHPRCIEPWLKMHSTCPTCRDQLPTDAYANYSVYAINTTIILQQDQAQLAPNELLELSASNQIIRAIVNARVRRNAPAAASAAVAQAIATPSVLEMNPPVMNASVLQRGSSITATLPQCITEPVVPMLHRNASRRRARRDDAPLDHPMDKRMRLETAAEQSEPRRAAVEREAAVPTPSSGMRLRPRMR